MAKKINQYLITESFHIFQNNIKKFINIITKFIYYKMSFCTWPVVRVRPITAGTIVVRTPVVWTNVVQTAVVPTKHDSFGKIVKFRMLV